jgi:hypothetical protein
MHVETVWAAAVQSLWLEGNPLAPAFVEQLLASLPSMTALKALGLDMGQLEGELACWTACCLLFAHDCTGLVVLPPAVL